MKHRKRSIESWSRGAGVALATVASAVLLSACGGGDSSSPVSQAQPQLPATLADSRQKEEAAALDKAMTMARAINANPMRGERPTVARN